MNRFDVGLQNSFILFFISPQINVTQIGSLEHAVPQLPLKYTVFYFQLLSGMIMRVQILMTVTFRLEVLIAVELQLKAVLGDVLSYFLNLNIPKITSS